MLAEYFSYAKDCLGNQILEFNIQEYDEYDEMLQALQNERLMIFMLAGIHILQKKRIYTYKHSLDLQPDGGNR